MSLGLLALLVAGAVLALLLDANRSKALRAGLSASTYLAGLRGWGMARGRAAGGPARMPALPFIVSGCGAGLVSGLVRPEIDVAVVAVQAAGAGLLLGGFHWFAVRTWRRVHARIGS